MLNGPNLSLSLKILDGASVFDLAADLPIIYGSAPRLRIKNLDASGKEWELSTGRESPVAGLTFKSITDGSVFTVQGNGDVVSSGGGFRQVIDGWFQAAVPKNQTAVTLSRHSSGTGDATGWLAPRDGSVTSVVAKVRPARATGTLKAEVYRNGVATGLITELNGQNRVHSAGRKVKDAVAFQGGDELDVRITTRGWAPTEANLRVSVEVEI